MRVSFANWQPDLHGLTNRGQQDIKNVVPMGGAGYGPLKSLAATSSTGLNSIALGAYSAQDPTGSTNTFAGTASKLYKLSANAFSDVSVSGGYSNSERWEFTIFGARVIAAQISNPVQYYDLGSSALFANLAGSPPQAKHIATIRDFVVLGNTTNSPNQLFWSGFNNSDQWTPGTNQSDSQTLQDGGPIQRIVGGEVGYVFQERAITRMSYVGTPLIFQFDLIEQARGLYAPGALATIGATSFYYSPDGFYQFDPVNGSQSIGNTKVDTWFANYLAKNTQDLMSAAADPLHKLVFWSFVSTDATDTSRPDTVLIYNYLSKEFTYAKFDHEMIFPALSTGLTLEQLGAIYPNLETVPASLDSGMWAGGNVFLGAFDTAHNLASFNGSNMAALLETTDFEGIQGKISLLTNVRPIIDTANATAVIRSRMRFADSVSDTSIATMQPNGDIPVFSTGRYHRTQISIPAAEDWTYATGVDIDAQDAGEL